MSDWQPTTDHQQITFLPLYSSSLACGFFIIVYLISPILIVELSSTQDPIKMYISQFALVAALAASVSAHGVVTEIQGANGVNMPGLTVADGTPRDCSSK